MADPASVLLGVALAFQQGLAARDEGRPAEAEAAFRRSIGAIEAMRRTIGVEERPA